VIYPCDGQTDRRTDGQAIAYSVLYIYAVARKKTAENTHADVQKIANLMF